MALEEFLVEAGQAVFLAAFLAAIDLLQAVTAHTHIVEGVSHLLEAIHAAVDIGRNGLDLTLFIQLADDGVEAHGLQEIEAVLFALVGGAAAIAAVAAHAGTQAGVQIGQLCHLAGVYLHIEEDGVFVGAIALAGGGGHQDVIAYEIGGLDPVLAAQIHFTALAGLQIIHKHTADLIVHPLIVAAIVQSQAQLLIVFQAGDLHIGAGDGLLLILAYVAEIDPAALFIHNALAVEPEGKLIEDLVILFFLDLLEHFFLLGAFQTFGGHGIVVILADAQEFAVAQHDQIGSGERQSKIFLGLAALDGDLVEHSVMEAFVGHGLVFSGAVAGEEDMLFIQPVQALFCAAACQLAHFSIFQQVDMGYILVGLHLGLRNHKGQLLAAGGSLQLGQHFHLTEIVDLNPFHGSSSSFTKIGVILLLLSVHYYTFLFCQRQGGILLPCHKLPETYSAKRDGLFCPY